MRLPFVHTAAGAVLAVALLAGCGDTRTTTSAETSTPASAPAASDANAGHNAVTGHAQMPSMVRLQEASGEAFDTAFLSEMIEHHQGALEMSEKALPELKRAELKEMAQKIIADQKKEIEQMTAWTKEWSGKEPDPELRQLMKTDMAPMMSAFENDCRTDCDRAFLTHMTMHHQMAVDMAKMAQEKATRPELKELAGKMAETQAREIEQFSTWLKEWYPGAPTAAEDHSGHDHP